MTTENGYTVIAPCDLTIYELITLLHEDVKPEPIVASALYERLGVPVGSPQDQVDKLHAELRSEFESRRDIYRGGLPSLRSAPVFSDDI